ncbi:transposase [Patescibacteria group bacterium]|nr:transposase [Patescibacteria group bacterium]MBU1457360.1 transposase [Patescibacteria group bacterium]
MPTKPRYFQAGSYYHVYNRGNRKQNIFFTGRDYSRFISKMREYKNSTGVEIICYCLMPNHIHLLAKPNMDESLSNFMLRLSTSHSKYLNIKYNLVGSLFQGRFKTVLIDNENYFKHLIRYIHINPLSLSLSLDKLHKYKWSSYGNYLNPQKSSLLTCSN